MKRKYDKTTRSDKLYNIWIGMKGRCYNPNHKDYKWYGGKGITICDEWLNNFEAFQQWSYAHGYKEGLSINRINSDNNYCSENCRWITLSEQQRNRSNLHYITYNNETHCITEWGEIYGLPRGTIKDRILYSHWSIEDALLTPKKEEKYSISGKANQRLK